MRSSARCVAPPGRVRRATSRTWRLTVHLVASPCPAQEEPTVGPSSQRRLPARSLSVMTGRSGGGSFGDMAALSDQLHGERSARASTPARWPPTALPPTTGLPAGITMSRRVGPAGRGGRAAGDARAARQVLWQRAWGLAELPGRQGARRHHRRPRGEADAHMCSARSCGPSPERCHAAAESKRPRRAPTRSHAKRRRTATLRRPGRKS